jgi:hypothetical protein
MCDPVIFAAVSTAAAIGGSVINYQTQSAQAEAQRRYQQQVFEQTKTLANANLVNQYAAITRRQVEEQTKASQEISEIVQQARSAKATAYASSIESGVAGLSVDALLDNYAMRESMFIQRTQAQERAVLDQLRNEAMGYSYQATGRIVGATPEPISGPSGLALAASITGATFDFFGTEENFEYFFPGPGGDD